MLGLRGIWGVWIWRLAYITVFKIEEIYIGMYNSIDDLNPASPSICYTTIIPRVFVCQVKRSYNINGSHIPGPQKHVNQMPFGLFFKVLCHCFAYCWGPGNSTVAWATGFIDWFFNECPPAGAG